MTEAAPELFESADDSALLFAQDERRKRYTAEQANALEWKRNAIVCLLAADWPVEVIARELHCNLRTVNALAARCAEEVAGRTTEFAQVCHRLGARWFGLAKTREQIGRASCRERVYEAE